MQIGSVNEYYLEFTALANRVHIEPPEALLDCFISGLKLDIRRDVVSQCPATLLRAIALAKLYEEKYTTFFSSLVRGSGYKVFRKRPSLNATVRTCKTTSECKFSIL